MAERAAAVQENATLRATLSALKAERGLQPATMTEQQQKAQAKLAAVELSKLELKHRQTIELKELQVKQLQEEIKEARDDLKSVQKQNHCERRSVRPMLKSGESCDVSISTVRAVL